MEGCIFEKFFIIGKVWDVLPIFRTGDDLPCAH